MKQLIILAALVSFSAPALATEAERERLDRKLCNSYKSMAISALSSRAGGVSVGQLVSSISDEYGIEITLRAFEYSLPEDKDKQVEALRQFSQEIYNDCQENYIPTL